MAELRISIPISTSDKETQARIDKVAAPQIPLDDASTKAILFLRGAAGRASHCLPVLYLHLGAIMSADEEGTDDAYAEEIKRHTLRHSSLGTIALCIRAIFDSASNPKPGLLAKRVTGLSESDFQKVADYWASSRAADGSEAGYALAFAQKLLARCAVHINDARRSDCVLTRRVALLRAYADRAAAHISLDYYEFNTVDVIHVVAATALEP